MTLRESIARRAHSSAERKVAIALGLSAFGASSGSEVPPPREWPPNGSSGDRSSSSVIGLCSREARTSDNGPPRAPAAAGRRPAGPGVRARARAGGWERRGAAGAGRSPGAGRVSVHERGRRRHRRQGPAAAHSRPTTRRADRTEPIEPAPTPDPAYSLPSLLPIPRPPYPRLPPRRLDGRPTGLKSDTNPPITPAPAPLPPPRPRPTSTRLG